MPVLVSLVDGATYSIEGDAATIGSDPGCTISLPNDPRVKPQHALLRRFAGRWMIEARAGDELCVGAEPPAKVKWLNPGDTVDLTGRGPQLVFQPAETALSPAAPAVGKHPAVRPALEPPSARPVPKPSGTPAHDTRGAGTAAGKRRLFWIGGGIAGLVLVGFVALVQIRGRSRINAEAHRGRSDRGQVAPATNGQADATSAQVPATGSEGAPQGAAVAQPLSADTVLAQARGALYEVVLRGQEQDATYRLGTAWAVAPTTLVSSGAIGLAIEELRDTLPGARVSSVASDQEYGVEKVEVHPAYRAAETEGQSVMNELALLQNEVESNSDKEKIEELARKRVELEGRLFQAFEREVAFDLAVIEIKGSLPQTLETQTSAEPQPGARIWLVGAPCKTDEFLIDRDRPITARGLEGTLFLKRSVGSAPEAGTRLLINITGDLTGQNWSGSPLLSDSGRVIGLYSRPTPPLPEHDAAPPTQEAAAIGSLRALMPR